MYTDSLNLKSSCKDLNRIKAKPIHGWQHNPSLKSKTLQYPSTFVISYMRKIHPNIIRYTERYWYVSMCGEREGDRRHRDVSITCDFGIREKTEQKNIRINCIMLVARYLIWLVLLLCCAVLERGYYEFLTCHHQIYKLPQAQTRLHGIEKTYSLCGCCFFCSLRILLHLNKILNHL